MSKKRNLPAFTAFLAFTQSQLHGELGDIFYTREDACEAMLQLRECVATNAPDGMMEPHRSLFTILTNASPAYVQDHHDANGRAVALMTSFADPEKVENALDAYEKYIPALPDRNAVEQRFIDKLHELYTQYRSSSDYMTRLTERLIDEKLLFDENGNERNEPTQVRILRQFIYRFGWFEKTPYACKTVAELVQNEYGGDFEKAAVCADTQTLMQLFNKGNGADNKWKANVCAVVSQRGVLVKATAVIRELVLRVFAPSVCKQGADFANAVLLADCFREDVTQMILPAVTGKKEDAEKLEAAIRQELKNCPPAIEDYPFFIRMATLDKYYADNLTVTPDNPLLTQPETKYLCKNNSPLTGTIKFNAIFISDRTRKIQYSIAVSEEMLCGLRMLEEGIDKKDYAEKLKKTEKTKLDNRKDTCQEKTKGGNGSEIADIACKLAQGYFDSQKKTREYLYLYALAFDMTFCFSDAAEPDKNTDIRINLFEDYYNDNIINYIGREKATAEEKMVDGYGINYKNFFEIIFLYYIVRKMRESAELPPDSADRTSHLQFLQQAFATVQYCASQCEGVKNEDEDFSFDSEKLSAEYKTDLLERILCRDEDTFREWVIENYDCKRTGAYTTVNNENRTAFEFCSELYLYLNEIFFDVGRASTATSGVPTDKDMSDSVRNLREMIIDKVRALSLITKNATCRNHCTYCEQYARFKQSTFDPQSKCKSINTKDCPQQGKPICKEACAECAVYADINVYRFVPSIDCERYETCNFTAPQVGNARVTETDKYTMIRHLMLREYDALVQAYNQTVCDQWLEKYADDTQFCALLTYMEQRLCMFVDYGEQFRQADTSRTALLVLYYMYLVTKSPEHRQKKRTFSEYYKEFCNGFSFGVYSNADFDEPYRGINACLVDAGYQPVNPKNIFDVFICFLAYRDTYAPKYSFSPLLTQILSSM